MMMSMQVSNLTAHAQPQCHTMAYPVKHTSAVRMGKLYSARLLLSFSNQSHNLSQHYDITFHGRRHPIAALALRSTSISRQRGGQQRINTHVYLLSILGGWLYTV